MAASASEERVPVRILVDEVKNRVIFVQAGKDFVDVLLSFLTLPLGTIARLVAEECKMKKVSVGSLSSLYESVANLEVKHFWTETCKEMLLHPRNSMEAYCQGLKLTIDDTEKLKYFICENWDCSRQHGALLTTFKNQRCKCGKLMNREISPQNGVSVSKKGFVPDMATFIISDDLKVMPDNFQASVLLDLGDFKAIKEVTASVTQEEMVDLLKCSLLSETPLTDFFLKNKQLSQNPQPKSALVFNIGKPESNVGREMIRIKVMVRKSERKILFALAGEDFVDILFSFLTFPLGNVEQMLKVNSCLGSMDNLYKSVADIVDFRYLTSDIKGKLINSRLPWQFKIKNQILPIDEVSDNKYYCYSKLTADYYNKEMVSGYLTSAVCNHGAYKEICALLSYLEPQSSTGEIYDNYHGGRGFSKSPSLYMVSDDLVVTSSGSMSAISFLTKSRIPPQDLEEKVISIGMEEGLSILKASMISNSALTNGLSHFINPIKEEK